VTGLSAPTQPLASIDFFRIYHHHSAMSSFPDFNALIPHAGSMCLLDTVREFDRHRIICEASSHRDPANPLRHQQQLSVQAGIEYAAQAVAVHGGLLAQQKTGTSQPRGGMIAVLTDVCWHVERLDNMDGNLVILAEQLADVPQALNYRFKVSTNQQALIQGELIVALQNSESA
jgi:predicted hotdog family 3-hydroxylacyl-ACP dehydratase